MQNPRLGPSDISYELILHPHAKLLIFKPNTQGEPFAVFGNGFELPERPSTNKTSGFSVLTPTAKSQSRELLTDSNWETFQFTTAQGGLVDSYELTGARPSSRSLVDFIFSSVTTAPITPLIYVHSLQFERTLACLLPRCDL